MLNLESSIEEMRQKYESLKAQSTFQINTLIQLNEEIRNDMHKVEIKNKYKE